MIGRVFWDIEPLFEKAVPKVVKELVCPVCGFGNFFFKHAHAFRRGAGQYRVDIAVKCEACALVLQFGVHISQHEYEALVKVWGKQTLDYNDVGHIKIETGG